jgi:hypothetical protein
MEGITQEAIVAAPLKFNYWITSDIDVTTTVSGTARDMAAIGIWYGSQEMYTTTLLQTDPTHTIPLDLIMGSVTIEKGATLTLTVPTQNQNGNVVFAGDLRHQDQPPLPFRLYVAQWPLTSAAE